MLQCLCSRGMHMVDVNDVERNSTPYNWVLFKSGIRLETYPTGCDYQKLGYTPFVLSRMGWQIYPASSIQILFHYRCKLKTMFGHMTVIVTSLNHWSLSIVVVVASILSDITHCLLKKQHKCVRTNYM